MTKVKKLVSLPAAMVKRIRAEAKDNGISDSMVVRNALEHWFARLDKSAKKGS